MPSGQVLERFIAMVESNAHAEAIERFYTENASMQENEQPPRRGRDLLVANERKVLARMRSVRSRCVRPVFVRGDDVVIRWVFEFETLDGGRQASTEPRVGVFHQARFSGIAGRQVTGRTHRDHQVSPWNIAYAEDTVEEQVGKVMVERIAAASDTVGSDTTGLADLAQLLGADWLPASTLTEDGD